MTFGDGRVTAHRVVLVGEPNHEDDVERRGRVVKELGHDGFHSCKRLKKKQVIKSDTGNCDKMNFFFFFFYSLDLERVDDKWLRGSREKKSQNGVFLSVRGEKKINYTCHNDLTD